jgi:C-terminal processing protease CtpA/Prc
MPQEFEISMTKVNGSLGFTLRKEDESILGHYIRSLVKEPAISDGRIKPGDKIISVSDIVLLANKITSAFSPPLPG